MSVRLVRNPHLLSLARCARGRRLQDLDGRTLQNRTSYGPNSAALNQSLRPVHTKSRGMLGTTVLCVRKDNRVIIIGDGQGTLGNEIIKPNVRKVRRLGTNVIGGFAGGTADSFTVLERSSLSLKNTLARYEELVRRICYYSFPLKVLSFSGPKSILSAFAALWSSQGMMKLAVKLNFFDPGDLMAADESCSGARQSLAY